MMIPWLEELEQEKSISKEAKLAKDYATSDAIRESLAAKGVEVPIVQPAGMVPNGVDTGIA